jgi:hypothetical protein
MKARLASSLTSFRLSPTRLDYANITWFSFTTAAVHLTLQAADAFTVCGNAAGLPLALDHSETPQVEVAGSGTAMAPVVMLVAQRTSPVAPQMGLHDYISLAGPVWEEFFFRSCLLSVLEKSLGMPTAVILTSILSGLFHRPPALLMFYVRRRRLCLCEGRFPLDRCRGADACHLQSGVALLAEGHYAVSRTLRPRPPSKHYGVIRPWEFLTLHGDIVH